MFVPMDNEQKLSFDINIQCQGYSHIIKACFFEKFKVVRSCFCLVLCGCEMGSSIYMPPKVCTEVQILHISFLLGGTPEIKHYLLNLLPRNRFPHAMFP